MAGGVGTEWYPDYRLAWIDAGCLNTVPVLLGAPPTTLRSRAARPHTVASRPESASVSSLLLLPLRPLRLARRNRYNLLPAQLQSPRMSS